MANTLEQRLTAMQGYLKEPRIYNDPAAVKRMNARIADVQAQLTAQNAPTSGPTTGITIPKGEAAKGKSVRIGGSLYPSQEWYDVNVAGKQEATSTPAPSSSMNWSSLYNTYSQKANQQNWDWFWIGSNTNTADRRYYRKENGQWIQRGSEAEARQKFTSTEDKNTSTFLQNLYEKLAGIKGRELNSVEKKSIANEVATKGEAIASVWEDEFRQQYNNEEALGEAGAPQAPITTPEQAASVQEEIDRLKNIVTEAKESGIKSGEEIPGTEPSISPLITPEEDATNREQLADLQAQQTALSEHGLTDTDQLTQTESGDYVPAEYDTGNEMMDKILAGVQKMLDDNNAAGEVVNPNIELSPEVIQGFMDKAIASLSPYYVSYIESIQDDLTADIKQLQESYNLNKEQRVADFQASLSGQRETEATRGTIFSGGRMKRAQALQGEHGRSLQALESGTLGTARKLGQTAERDIGTAEMGGNIPTVQTGSLSLLGEGQYVPISDRSLYDLQGGQYGSLTRERRTAENLLATDFETAHREGRSLNFYN